MKKSFTLKVDNSEYAVEVNANSFVINGQPFIVGIEEAGKVLVNGIAFEISLDGDTAIVDGIRHHFQVGGLDEKNTPDDAKEPSAPALGAGAITAMMPGTIVRVLVSEGDAVVAGDLLVVLEAMKMENELHAPVDGVIQAVYVQPGQAVETNAVLVDIRPTD